MITEHPITQITYKRINQYSTDACNNCKINKTHNVKKTCSNYNNDVFVNKPQLILIVHTI